MDVLVKLVSGGESRRSLARDQALQLPRGAVVWNEDHTRCYPFDVIAAGKPHDCAPE
jgi:hypothetical protein